MFWLEIYIILFYAAVAYGVWWALSRLALLLAWLYSKPGQITWKHWIIITLSLFPFVMEINASAVLIFALALGDRLQVKQQD